MKFLQTLNKKIILGVIALLFATVFIVISSFFPFFIDPERWNSPKFISDELIIIAIVIFSMMSSMLIGQASNAQNPKSELAKSKVKFNETTAKGINISKFSQWVKKVLQPRDVQTIKEREMRYIGIEDYSVIDLDTDEIISLVEGPKQIRDRFYRRLTSKQAKKLVELKEGSTNIKLVEPVYYITVKAIDNDRTITERSGQESTKKTVLISWSTFSKGLLTLIPSIIFAALVRDVAAGGGEGAAAEAAMQFTSRMFAMISSTFMGYFVGCQINDIDADYINMRILVLNDFLQDTGFKAKSVEEIAKEEFDNTCQIPNNVVLLNKDNNGGD